MSVDVPLVAAAALELADIILGPFAPAPALFGDDRDQGVVHVRRHPRRVAAEVEMGAFLAPGVEIAGALEHAVLDIGLVRAVAREGDVHAVEKAVLQPRLPFGLVKEVASKIALAEEQPGTAACAPRLALLKEGPIGGDSGAGADHDDGCIVPRQSELLVRLD